MQNAHTYFRLVPAGGYRLIGTGSFSRVSSGLDSFSENVIVRGDLERLHTLFPVGDTHPAARTATNKKYVDFWVSEVTGGRLQPAWAETVCTATIKYEGVLDIAARPIREEWGILNDQRYFAALAGPSSPLTAIPGKPTNVNNISVTQMVPAYKRDYVSKTNPAIPAVNLLAGTNAGSMVNPVGFSPPDVPNALTWLVAAEATYNFPWGWTLANRTSQRLLLSGGTPTPVYVVSELWTYKPARTTLNT